MGFSKGHALADEIIGQLGRQQPATLNGLLQALSVHFEPTHQFRQDLKRCRDRVQCIEQGRLVLLQVPIIAQGEGLHHSQKINQLAVHPACSPPDQLRHVGILFLRHHAAAGAKPLREVDELEFLRRPHDQLFAQPRQMHHRNRQRCRTLDHEVTIRDGIQAVGRHVGETLGGLPYTNDQRGNWCRPVPQIPAASRSTVSAHPGCDPCRARACQRRRGDGAQTEPVGPVCKWV